MHILKYRHKHRLAGMPKMFRELFLPGHSRALVPNEALEGMTSGLSTVPFPGEHLPWLQEPSVPAGDSTPEGTGRLFVTAHNFYSISENQSKAIYHSSLQLS